MVLSQDNIPHSEIPIYRHKAEFKKNWKMIISTLMALESALLMVFT